MEISTDPNLGVQNWRYLYLKVRWYLLLQKRTKSKLLSWKVQNSRALDTLEQHDSRVARHVEAKQVAKLERLYTMASAFGEKQPGVEELETVRKCSEQLLLFPLQKLQQSSTFEHCVGRRPRQFHVSSYRRMLYSRGHHHLSLRSIVNANS